MTTTASNLKENVFFDRATGTIGAWVHGVTLETRGAEIADTLRQALAQHGVLFFNFGRVPSLSEFTEFAELFGEVEKVYGQKKIAASANDVPLIDEDRLPMKDYNTMLWHVDGSPFERPPLAAILTAVEVPEVGGDTMWSSMYAAWDALSPHYQRLLKGLEAVHSNVRCPFLEPKQFTHPAVVTDPITGRKSLFVNSVYTERFIGLTEKENDSLLKFLFDHVNNPDFHVRLRWKPGYVAVWHQRVTQHRAVGGVVGPRKLRRLTIAGDHLTK